LHVERFVLLWEVLSAQCLGDGQELLREGREPVAVVAVKASEDAHRKV
jgi:hypothetical protein